MSNLGDEPARPYDLCAVLGIQCILFLSLGEGFLGSNLKHPPQAIVLNVVPLLVTLFREAVKPLGDQLVVWWEEVIKGRTLPVIAGSSFNPTLCFLVHSHVGSLHHTCLSRRFHQLLPCAGAGLLP